MSDADLEDQSLHGSELEPTLTIESEDTSENITTRENEQVEAMEIEDDVPEDLEGLLRKKDSSSSGCLCCRMEGIGNYKIFAPRLYQRSGWGIVGPHWYGPPAVLAVLAFASSYYIEHSLHRIGPVTAGICALFTILCIYNLVQCCFRDPGIVRAHHQVPQEYRWCDVCNNFQPQDGAHCQDCNVCISGFDHHCVWMGSCIGKGNMKYFIRFNLSWLLYLTYAIFWCNIFGPLIFRHHKA